MRVQVHVEETAHRRQRHPTAAALPEGAFQSGPSRLVRARVLARDQPCELLLRDDHGHGPSACGGNQRGESHEHRLRRGRARRVASRPAGRTLYRFLYRSQRTSPHLRGTERRVGARKRAARSPASYLQNRRSQVRALSPLFPQRAGGGPHMPKADDRRSMWARPGEVRPSPKAIVDHECPQRGKQAVGRHGRWARP